MGTGTGIMFHPALPEDVPVIFDQCKALIDAYEDGTAIDYPRVMAWVERKIRDHLHQYTRVCRDDQTVAYYRLVLEKDKAELDDLYVLPGFRGEGIGAQILQKCFDDCKIPIFLYVFTENTGAIRFYERHGFLIHDQVSPTRCILLHT